MLTENIYFITAAVAVFALILIPGFYFLPRERFQFIAAIPDRNMKSGKKCPGKNITWYGLITGFSVAVSAVLFTVLSTAYGFGIRASFIFVAIILAFSLPASKIVALIVERRKGTITVGGAAFVGILISPAAAYGSLLLTSGGNSEGILPLIAALGTAYLAGEGIGRLSCLSFGCCYGKPLKKFSPFFRAVFSPFSIRFKGKLKKAAYEDGYENKKLFPIQNLTAVIYSCAAVASSALYISGYYRACFIFSLCTAFAWRILSEFLRDDFRGGKKFSAYQIMSAAGIVICIVFSMLFPEPAVQQLHITKGFAVFTSVPFVLAVEMLWMAVFLYTGISSVTDSTIIFIKKKSQK